YGWGDGEWMRNWEASCKEAGANLITPSCIKFAPASLQEASQFRIHSPSPQPYEPKRPIFFPDKPFLQSSNIGANSVSSSSSSPIEGQPKAMASYSAILSPEKAAASNTSASAPASFIPCSTS